ncbi:hypothetical protein Ciccas_006449 [Cichlidogyrus casuarinus]|uniref:ELM2 domain-containing protein n=1 Tax=Cichlidogyrus casuarinus TaxID=1844966 RepID=A0ABD2Q6Q7_9PLAT
MDTEVHSRIGVDFQVRIPQVINVPPSKRYNESESNFEVSLWTPSNNLSDEALSEFLRKASYYGYREESARVFLHWHNYNLKNATDDLPNYTPFLNKWNKNEVKRFLKFLDHKSRKDFAILKRSFPKHELGEIASLYYQIAAPIRTRSKIDNKAEDNLRQCLEKASNLDILPKNVTQEDVDHRLHIQQVSLSPFASVPQSQQPRQLIGKSEDGFERLFDRHLISLLGIHEAKRVNSKLMLDRPFPVKALIDDTIPEDLKLISHDNADMNGISELHSTDSSCNNSQNERYTLPQEIHYSHNEFLRFLNNSDAVDAELPQDLDKILAEMDEGINNARKSVNEQSRTLLQAVDALKPPDGIPKISYRWTKKELALTLTAITRLGFDFRGIAKIVGTKSESFIRDFYNRWNYKSVKPTVKVEEKEPEKMEESAGVGRLKRTRSKKTLEAVDSNTGPSSQEESPCKSTPSKKKREQQEVVAAVSPSKRQSKRQVVPPRRHSP